MGPRRGAGARLGGPGAVGGRDALQDLGHARHAAPAANGGARAVDIGARHLRQLPQAGVVEGVRHRARRGRAADRGGGRDARRPRADPGRAGRRRGRPSRVGPPRREAARELGRVPQARGLPRAAPVRAQPGPQCRASPSPPRRRRWIPARRCRRWCAGTSRPTGRPAATRWRAGGPPLRPRRASYSRPSAPSRSTSRARSCCAAARAGGRRARQCGPAASRLRPVGGGRHPADRALRAPAGWSGSGSTARRAGSRRCCWCRAGWAACGATSARESASRSRSRPCGRSPPGHERLPRPRPRAWRPSWAASSRLSWE